MCMLSIPSFFSLTPLKGGSKLVLFLFLLFIPLIIKQLGKKIAFFSFLSSFLVRQKKKVTFLQCVHNLDTIGFSKIFKCFFLDKSGRKDRA